MLPVVVKGKNLEVSDALREYVEGKVGKLDRHLEGPIPTTAEISREKTRSQVGRWVVQVTMQVGGSMLRGEERAADPHAAVDAVVSVLSRQIERFKGKHYRNRQKGGQPKIAEVVGEPEETRPLPPAEEMMPVPFTGKVVRIKRFAMKPMFYEEAAEQMELLGHGFYFFLNGTTGQFNVIYRRQDGDYGLIEPVLA